MMRRVLQPLLLIMLALVATASAQTRGVLSCNAAALVTPGHEVALTCWEGYNDHPKDVSVELFPISAQDAIEIHRERKLMQEFASWKAQPVAHVTMKATARQQFYALLTLPAPGQYVVRFHAGDLYDYDRTGSSTIGVMTLVAPGKRIYIPIDLRTFRVTPYVRSAAVFTDQGSHELHRDAAGMYVDEVASETNHPAAYLEADDGSIALPDEGWGFPTERRQVHGFVETDRSLYRPGDTVYLRAILRRGTIGAYAIDRSPVTVNVTGGYPERTVAHRVLTPNEFGSINTSFRIPEDASLGNYSIQIPGIYDSAFDVEAYKKPEYTLDVQPKSPYIVSGDTATFTVHAQYLFGSPASGMRLTYNGYVYQDGYFHPYTPFHDSHMRDGYDNSSFDNSAQTNADGNATIAVPTKALGLQGNINLKVDARDESGRTVSAESHALIFPGTFDVDVTPERWLGSPKAPSSITIATRNHDATPRKGVRVTVHVVETSLRDGKWVDSEAGSVNVRTGTDGKAAFAFMPQHAGDYRFDATARDERGNVVEGYSYQWVPDPESNWVPPTEQPTLIPAKSVFAPGESIHVLLATNVLNRDAIVTVLSDRLVEHKVVHVTGYTADIAIAAPRDAQHLRVEAYVPGENGVANAQIVVNILPPVTALTITARADRANYQPGQTAVVRLHAVDAHHRPVRAEISLAVVDEGIFAMQNQVLDPNAPFYDAIASTSYFLDWYRPNQFPLKMIAKVTSSSLGGLIRAGVASDIYTVKSGSEQGVPMNAVTLRRDFRDTAYWTPGVFTDAHGDAVVRFRWPENLTTWRTTAVGVTPRTQLGVAIARNVVTKPLLVRLETPRFLRAGDHAAIVGIVHGKYAAEAVHMLLDAQPLSSPEPVRDTRLDTHGRASESWNVAAPGVGSAQLALRASGASGSDGMQVALPLLGGTALEHRRDAGIAHSAVTIPLELGAGEMQGDVHLSFSPSALAELVQTLREFDVYPYYCTEQTSSNAQVATAVLLAAKALPGITLDNDPQRVIDRALARLRELQHSDGGWGWWVTDDTNVDMTAYALATIAGIERATGTPQEGLTFSGGHALRAAIEHDMSDTRSVAYAAYALSQIHAIVPDAVVARLRAHVDRAAPYEAAMTGLTAIALHDDKLADRAVARLLATAQSNGGTVFWHDDRWTWSWWTDPIDATAYAVQLLEARDRPREAEAGIAFIRENRNGDWWYTTKDTAAAAMTLARFEREAPRTSTDETIRVLVDGNVARTVHLTQLLPDASDARVVLPASMLQGAKTITLDRSGSGTLYWSSDDVRYADRNAAHTRDASEAVLTRLFAAPPALSVNRRYSVDHPGPWRVGDTVTVDLWITAHDGARYVTVEDPFPAGVEYQPPQGQYGSGGYWWNGLQFLDDRAAFFLDWMSPNATVHLSYRLRATTQGTFVAPGPSAYASYGPPVSAVGTGEEVVIR